MIEQTKKIARRLFLNLGIDIRKVDQAEVNKYVWLQPYEIQTILDIGANTGQFATAIHSFCPTAKIYSFEPIRHCYEQLLVNLNHVKDFQAFNIALGESTYKTEIHRNEFAPSSSILNMAQLHKQAVPYATHSIPETITVKALDEIAHELSLVDNILIKIDVQGFEEKVIIGGKEVIAKAKVLIVETSFQILYEGQPVFKQIYDKLSGMGFSYRGNIEQWKSQIDGSVLQADAVFVR